MPGPQKGKINLSGWEEASTEWRWLATKNNSIKPPWLGKGLNLMDAGWRPKKKTKINLPGWEKGLNIMDPGWRLQLLTHCWLALKVVKY